MKKDVKKSIRSSKRIERVSTGIKDLDNLVEGGFEKNSTNLIIGDGGSGKTIFGVQFLIEGMKKGESCLYITFEEKKQDFYINMINLGFDLEKFEKEENFFFIEYTPEKVKSMLEEGGGIIEGLILRKKIKRVVIDSMTSFGMLFGNDLDKRQSLLSLFSMLKKWQCTSLLTYEGNTQDNKIAPDVLELESDSIIIFSYARSKKDFGKTNVFRSSPNLRTKSEGFGDRERYLEILKMRGTKHSSQLYNFFIGKGGISINQDTKL